MEPLEAPDLDPKPIFDIQGLILIAAIAMAVAIPLSTRIGNVGALFTFLLLFYLLLRTQRYVANRFPPGYWADKLSWIRTKPRYYPGRPRQASPLLRR